MAHKILTIAGTDPTGGAGIIRDIETFAAFGFNAAIAITSVNVQDDNKVVSINPLPAAIVRGQIEAALGTGKVVAIKIGQIATTEIANAIATHLQQYPALPIVLDPVLAASSGKTLAKEGLIQEIRTQLLPLATLITPNLPELALLSAQPTAPTEEAITQQANTLLNFGAKAVLAKGGHHHGENAIDILYSATKTVSFSNKRLKTTMRGTGCVLSSAIAAGLAQEKSLEDAVQAAKDYINSLMHATQDELGFQV